MLRAHDNKQITMEFVSIEELVPSDHLLRKIARVMDFEFIRDKVKDLYCADNGRPAVDPVVLFKMLFLGYLFGIRSERQLVRDIQVNVAYRWFLGYGLTDKIPDATTFSQNRRRRFNSSTVYQEIFDEVVLFGMRRKLISGRVLYTDSTHLKASANKHKFKKDVVEQSTRDYLAELDEAIEADRKAHVKKPLAEKPQEVESKEVKVSTTDPDSGYMVREGKPKGFFYLDHRTVDGRYNLITDTFVTPANVHDSIPYLERLDRQRDRFGFDVIATGLDAGYLTPAICKGLEERLIYGVISYRRPTHKEGYLRKSAFVYDAAADGYRCPQGQLLRYRTTNRQGYREYVTDPQHCRHCPLLGQCTRSANQTKLITRHVWEAYKERVDGHRLTEEGRRIYKRRKETIERSFADAKTVARALLCADARAVTGARTGSVGRRLPKPEKDGADPVSGGRKRRKKPFAPLFEPRQRLLAGIFRTNRDVRAILSTFGRQFLTTQK